MTYELKSIFGSVFKEKKNTLRTRRAMAKELYVPEDSIQLDTDQIEYTGGWDYYATNSDLWAFLAFAAGSYRAATLALYGSGTSLMGIIGNALSSFKALAALGAIPVWGWIAVGLVTAAAVFLVSVITTALVQNKGIYMWANVTFDWFNTNVSVGFNIR